MLESPATDALRSALDPVEALRGEQSQFESWVRESFADLESLHDELNEWQRDLTRQQAQLDQRAAGVAEAESRAQVEGRDLAALQAELARAQDDARQLEEENAEQLQTLDDLERQLVAAQTELRSARKHAEELADALEAERERAVDEHRLWTGELRDMRRVLQRQADMLISLGAAVPSGNDPEDNAAAAVDQPAEQCEGGDAPTPDAGSRAAELRRRASSRRANRRPT